MDNPVRQKSSNPARQTYTVEEAGALLGLGRNSVFKAVNEGNIPAIRIGRRLLVPRLAIERMLSGQPIK
jgi:excisionase family DNA binding protein